MAKAAWLCADLPGLGKEGVMLLQKPPVETCRHHWLIESAEGPTSMGVCQFCHEAREFKNSVDTGEDRWVTRGRSKTPVDNLEGG